MMQYRLWLLGALFVCFFESLTGQNCPSVIAARDTILASDDGGAAILKFIQGNCPGAPDSLSQLYHKLSISAYQKQDWAAAIDWAEQALETQRELYADGPEENLGKSLANLGLFHRNVGAYTQAMPYLREAEKVFTELGLWRRRHNNRENMVYIWHATGDLGRAAALLPDMLAEAREQEPGYNRTLAEAETLRLFGVQADESENHGAGRPYHEKAVLLFNEIGAFKPRLDTEMDIARNLYLMKSYEAARVKARSVLDLIMPYEAPYEKAVLYNLLSFTYIDQGKVGEAERTLEPGIEQAVLSKKPRVTALLYNCQSALELARKNYPAASAANLRAIGELTKGWVYSDETPLPSAGQLAASEFKMDLFKYLAFHAKALAEGGEAAGAREAVEAGDVMADLLRADFSGSVSKLFWRKEAMPLYELGIRLADAAENEEAILYYLEKSRSALLLEALLEADLLQKIDPELAAELSALERRLATVPSVARTDSLIELRQRIADRNPAARALVDRPEMVDLAKARQNLAAGGWDRQLHFFAGAERTYAFSLTATSARTVDLGPSTDLAPALRALMNFYTGPAAIDKDPIGFLTASHEVYNLLLDPLNIASGEKLLVLPDGLLAYLPFNALVTEAGATDVASASYLIRHNPVSYAQSATILDRQMQKRPLAQGGSLAFAPFMVPAPESKVPALTHSLQEVKGFQQRYSATMFGNGAADRETLLKESADRYILHLSTHAYATADGKNPPRILTADAPVYPFDVYGLDLNADLVTLSACESNIGPLAVGEGVLSLGRAFTAAGARGVVASLWSLNDRATVDIVTSFYDELAAGASKPLALHEAQLAYLNRKDLPGYLKSPYYWAGLTYYGDGAEMPAEGWGWWPVVLGVGALFLLAVGLLWSLRAR